MNELMERERATGDGERREEEWCEERKKKQKTKKKTEQPRSFHACKLHYGGRISLMSYTAHDNCRVGLRLRVDVCCNPKNTDTHAGII